jgi:hypothetical protein
LIFIHRGALKNPKIQKMSGLLFFGEVIRLGVNEQTDRQTDRQNRRLNPRERRGKSDKTNQEIWNIS